MSRLSQKHGGQATLVFIRLLPVHCVKKMGNAVGKRYVDLQVRTLKPDKRRGIFLPPVVNFAHIGARFKRSQHPCTSIHSRGPVVAGCATALQYIDSQLFLKRAAPWQLIRHDNDNSFFEVSPWATLAGLVPHPDFNLAKTPHGTPRTTRVFFIQSPIKKTIKK